MKKVRHRLRLDDQDGSIREQWKDLMKSVGVERFTGYGNTMVGLSTVNAMDNVVDEIDKIFDSITGRQLSEGSRII
ncbi:MAG: hypothetical protein NZ807_00805 [Dehalococcoidia bacterium]|nr:hypothetical protein [Dehalococcoidia bacterium]